MVQQIFQPYPQWAQEGHKETIKSILLAVRSLSMYPPEENVVLPTSAFKEVALSAGYHCSNRRFELDTRLYLFTMQLPQIQLITQYFLESDFYESDGSTAMKIGDFVVPPERTADREMWVPFHIPARFITEFKEIPEDKLPPKWEFVEV